MTTQALTRCPEWCTLKPGHDWDSELPDGSLTRGHGGATFGKYVGVSGWESADEPGKVLIVGTVDTDGADLDPEDLTSLAASCIEAAAWLRDVAGAVA